MGFTLKTVNLYFLIVFIFASCNNPTDSNKQEIESTDTLIQTDKTTSDKVNDVKSTFEIESYHNQEVLASYQSASMYAAATHYYFETEEGQEILVVDGMDEEIEVKLPNNMLEKMEPEEGLPDANPEFIGNNFTLYFNEKGKVYKVIPLR
jgi:hypothetical protein